MTATTAHRAIDLCNCCDAEPAAANPAGYCPACLAAAHAGRLCDHDSEG